jgi:hypothetical protein
VQGGPSPAAGGGGGPARGRWRSRLNIDYQVRMMYSLNALRVLHGPAAVSFSLYCQGRFRLLQGLH